MHNKKSILSDIKRVASKIGHAPTREEYRDNGKVNEHAVRAFFGTWSQAVIAAGLVPVAQASVMDDSGLQIAKQGEEIRFLRRRISELEDGIMDADKIKDLIGTRECDTGGEGSDWLKGCRFPGKASVSGIPTLFLSDWHFDEVVKPEQVNGMNEYNREIADKRIKFTFAQAVKLLKHHLVSPKYEGIICPLGGDMVSGNIHDELAETNAEVINKTLLHFSSILSDGIGMLADEFGKVFVPCVVGNHGRHHKKPRFKNQVIENYEWLMYHMIARHFKADSRISFMIPEAADAFYSVYGNRICLTHGNQFRGGEGVGGIMVPILRGLGKKQTREAAVDRNFSFTMIGHWHQYIHMRNLLINGAGKGYDEYAFGNNFSYEPPTQALFIHHRERGIIYPMSIDCSGYEAKEGRKGPSIVW